MGVIDRVKEVAGRKKAQFDEGVEKEKRYTAYKHPEADYIVHGQRPYGPKTKAQSEEDDEFSARRVKEQEQAAERREKVKVVVRAGAKTAARTAKAGAVVAGRFAKKGIKKLYKEMSKPKPRPAPQRAEPRGRGMFEMGGGGMLADPMGFNSSRGKRSVGFSPFSSKPIDPLGFGGKKRRQAKFSLF